MTIRSKDDLDLAHRAYDEARRDEIATARHTTTTTCPTCNGGGEVFTDIKWISCSTCHGTGTIEVREKKP